MARVKQRAMPSEAAPPPAADAQSPLPAQPSATPSAANAKQRSQAASRAKPRGSSAAEKRVQWQMVTFGGDARDTAVKRGLEFDLMFAQAHDPEQDLEAAEVPISSKKAIEGELKAVREGFGEDLSNVDLEDLTMDSLTECSNMLDDSIDLAATATQDVLQSRQATAAATAAVRDRVQGHMGQRQVIDAEAVRRSTKHWHTSTQAFSHCSDCTCTRTAHLGGTRVGGGDDQGVDCHGSRSQGCSVQPIPRRLNGAFDRRRGVRHLAVRSERQLRAHR